jgi:hypothetical protein
MTHSQLCRQSLSKAFVEAPVKMAYFDKGFRQRLCDMAFGTDSKQKEVKANEDKRDHEPTFPAQVHAG